MDSISSKPQKIGYFRQQIKFFKKNKSIFLFIIPAILLTFLFGYIPMTGIIFGFKESIDSGNWFYDVLTQPFTGNHILKFFSDFRVINALKNTLIISGVKILIFFPLTIILAIFLSEIRRPALSKLILIILCLPNFLSWPVVIGIWNNLLNLDSGLINNLIGRLGGDKIYFFNEYFKALVVFLSIWKGLGWGSIYFYAAIMSIDREYYEAAQIDGANKFQQIRYLTLPGILPVIALQLVMNITYILDAGFDQVYAMLSLVPTKTDDEAILGTFIMKLAMEEPDVAFTVAMSVVQGLFALVLMLVGNAFFKKKLGRSLW
jgi:putative aldouronate transport system permease protein